MIWSPEDKTEKLDSPHDNSYKLQIYSPIQNNV